MFLKIKHVTQQHVNVTPLSHYCASCATYSFGNILWSIYLPSGGLINPLCLPFSRKLLGCLLVWSKSTIHTSYHTSVCNLILYVYNRDSLILLLNTSKLRLNDLLVSSVYAYYGVRIVITGFFQGRRLAAVKHNEQVGINRRLIARMIHVVCFFGKQELAFCGHRENNESLNKGNYLELLELLAQEEQLLKEHLLSSAIFKGTSKMIQNDLIECVTSVLNSKIFNEIQRVNYVSIQADETTDVSCRSQMSIIFRYVVERFIGFFDVSKNKTASGLADIILSEINKWKIGNKIIC
ncbi:hypothetical protein QTP88_014683 [Uroleucon formosanum]